MSEIEPSPAQIGVGTLSCPHPVPELPSRVRSPGPRAALAGHPVLQPWELEHQEQSQRPGAPHGSCPRVWEGVGSWAPAPAQAVTLSTWQAETSLCPFNVTRGPRGQLLGGDACLISPAGTVFSPLLRFAPSALHLLSYWLIFHLASW